MVILTALVTPPLLKAAFAKPCDQSTAAPPVIWRPRRAVSKWTQRVLMLSPPMAVAPDVDDVAMEERKEPRHNSGSCSEAGRRGS